MELKDFIEETLIQIVSGVKAAQDKGLGFGAVISPGHVDSCLKRAIYKGKEYVFNDVEFEVELTLDKSTENKKGIAVAFGNIGIGAQNKSEAGSASLTRVKFSVPVGLPSIETKQIEKPKKVAGGLLK